MRDVTAARIVDPPQNQTDQLKALFDWAKKALKGQFEALANATTREQLEAIKFDADDPAVIVAINDALYEFSATDSTTARKTERRN